MIAIKTTVTSAASGEEVSTPISGEGVKKPTDTFTELNPNDASACPTGTCGDTSNLVSAGSSLSSLGTSLAAANAALGAAETNDLWQSLICGKTPTGINSPINVKNDLDTSALWLRSTGCTVEGLVKLLKVEDGKLGLDTKEIQKRLDKTLNASLANMDNAARVSIVTAMAGNLNTSPADLEMRIGEATVLIEAAKANDAKGFTELLKTATGSSALIEFLDLEAEAAILDHLIDQAIQLGIPQAIDIVLEKIEDDKIRRKIILNNIRSSAIWSDLDYIDKAVELVGSSGVLARVPDLISLITRYYSIPRRSKSSDYGDLLGKLKSTLNGVDPSWMFTTKLDVVVGNLEAFTEASNDCEKLFLLDENLVTSTLIGKAYKVQSISSVAKFNYAHIGNI